MSELAKAPPLNRTRLGRLTVLFAAHALGPANIMLFLAFAPLVQRDLGLSTAGFGLAVSAYSGAQVVFPLPAGWLVDRFGPRLIPPWAHVALAGGIGLAAASRW